MGDITVEVIEDLSEQCHNLTIENNLISENEVINNKKETAGVSITSDIHRMVHILENIHCLTTAELKQILGEIGMSSQGNKKQLKEKVKRFFKKEYALYKLTSEKLQGRTKTARHFEYLVILDFECTCELVNNFYPHEIIEFPAVLVDVRKMKIIDTFQTYVRPVLNPVLEDFCISLCGIQQETVDAAPYFPKALELFTSWMKKHGLGDVDRRFAFVTDGPHDLWKFFQFQCKLSGLKMPHEFRHFINVKRIFEQKVSQLPRGNGKTGIQNMLAHYKMVFKGRHHCGLDDSINLARICIRMMKDKVELIINQTMSRKKDNKDEVVTKNKNNYSGMHPLDKSAMTDLHIWRSELELKLRVVHKMEFTSREYLECESCEEELESS